MKYLSKSQFIQLLTIAICLLFSLETIAKDLTHRFGVGIKNTSSVNLPSAGAVYYAEKDLAYTGSFGLDTQKDNSAMQASVGLRSVVFFENNLNAYYTGQIGMLTIDTLATGKKSGVDVLGGVGAEFFFTGLENLGFTVELTMGISTLNSTRVYTSAQDPFHAGIIFYF